MRNLIWNGDLDRRKVVTIGWNKCCKSYKKGSLGIRSLKVLNDVSNLHLCWSLVQENSSWSKMLSSRVLRCNRAITYHIYSSLCSGLKNQHNIVKEHSQWLIVNGNNIHFLLDCWMETPLVQKFKFHSKYHKTLA